MLADVTGLLEHYTRITNNTPFLECVVKILNDINSKKPITFDKSKEEVDIINYRFLYFCLLEDILQKYTIVYKSTTFLDMDRNKRYDVFRK